MMMVVMLVGKCVMLYCRFRFDIRNSIVYSVIIGVVVIGRGSG